MLTVAPLDTGPVLTVAGHKTGPDWPLATGSMWGSQAALLWQTGCGTVTVCRATVVGGGGRQVCSLLQWGGCQPQTGGGEAVGGLLECGGVVADMGRLGGPVAGMEATGTGKDSHTLEGERAELGWADQIFGSKKIRI